MDQTPGVAGALKGVGAPPSEFVQLAEAMMRADQPHSPAADASLAEAERRGFRLAVIGRTCALVPIALFYFAISRYPNNIYLAGLILAAAMVGLAPLALVGSRFERAGRYAFFAFDVAILSAILALAPLSTGGDVPQNLVFLSSRGEYFFVVVAISVLTLSPGLVLWTGLCAVLGLAGATAWIMAGMDRMVSFADLPPSPSREAFLSVATDPDFLAISSRVSEGVKIALVTGIAALAVYRARAVVRSHAIVETERSRIQQLFGRYVPAQVAEQLINSGQLSPQTREASLIFADIEGFTHLSETLAPAQVIGMLNSFFSAATEVVDRHGGVVVNHVGDALIAAFNAPLPVENYQARAVSAARALLLLVAARDFEGHRLRLRIGIATGSVAAGAVGAAERQTYTLYGDTVNLAQRLERMNKELETSCLICGTTFKAAQSSCGDAVAIGELQVRGRDRTVEVFSLGGEPSRSTAPTDPKLAGSQL
jgi:adenylate cyclase